MIYEATCELLMIPITLEPPQLCNHDPQMINHWSAEGLMYSLMLVGGLMEKWFLLLSSIIIICITFIKLYNNLNKIYESTDVVSDRCLCLKNSLMLDVKQKTGVVIED